MKVVIIEDERLAAEKLASLIEQTDSSLEIIARLESVSESINWLVANEPPDIIFMDIQLDDGISFEIFDAVKIQSPVIFTTAYDQYAIRAFKVNSVDYLLKPIDRKGLELALRKFHQIHSNFGVEEKISKVIEQLSSSWKNRFFVKIGNHFQSVPVDEITCFFVAERCTFLRIRSGKIFALDYSLEQLQKKVNPNLFFRINRNYIVNIHFITDILSYSTNRLKIKLQEYSNDGLIVSRDKVLEFKLWLDR
jgi:DNA-binding LytR/AlgR family response regulator